MRTADRQQIGSLHFFLDMAEDSFAAIPRGAFLQRFPRGTTLIEEGDKADFLHVVVEGSVEQFSRHGGSETSLAVLRPVSTFILAAAVGDLPYLASGRTLEPSRLLMLPAETIRQIFGKDNGFARAIIGELSRSFRGVMKELKNPKFGSGSERLANWILAAAEMDRENGRFNLPFDKRTLASRLGMTPENLSRNLALLAKHGVAVRGSEVTVRDPEKLTDSAKPTPAIDDFGY